MIWSVSSCFCSLYHTLNIPIIGGSLGEFPLCFIYRNGKEKLMNFANGQSSSDALAPLSDTVQFHVCHWGTEVWLSRKSRISISISWGWAVSIIIRWGCVVISYLVFPSSRWRWFQVGCKANCLCRSDWRRWRLGVCRPECFSPANWYNMQSGAGDGLIITSPACRELLHGLIFIHITSLRAGGLLHADARRKLQNAPMN